MYGIYDDEDTLDIGYCTRCGKQLDGSVPAASQHCNDCVDLDD